MKRHSGNSNLHLYHDLSFKGFELLPGHAPYVQEYLEVLYQTLIRANTEYRRLMALRVDLMPPHGVMARLTDEEQGKLMTRFLESLKAQIEADRHRARKASGKAASCTLRYVWCREFYEGQHRRGPHFHCLFLFNKDAYFTPGRVGQPGDNLVNRISKAWHRALGLTWDPGTPLIHLPRNCCYIIKSREDRPGMASLFQRASYLCKADTKLYGDHRHAFGASRV
ncbi:MAG: inovirus Gp2 family protein [Gammaproteobacteria bacterium]|nr:inovirus Gp2 family protein [Gammaproteobacteria bacterium]